MIIKHFYKLHWTYIQREFVSFRTVYRIQFTVDNDLTWEDREGNMEWRLFYPRIILTAPVRNADLIEEYLFPLNNCSFFLIMHDWTPAGWNRRMNPDPPVEQIWSSLACLDTFVSGSGTECHACLCDSLITHQRHYSKHPQFKNEFPVWTRIEWMEIS